MQTHLPSEREHELPTATTATEEPTLESTETSDSNSNGDAPASAPRPDTTAEVATGETAESAEHVHGEPTEAIETLATINAERDRADELAERASDLGTALVGEPTEAVTGEETGDSAPVALASDEAAEAIAAEPANDPSEAETAPQASVQASTEDPGEPSATEASDAHPVAELPSVEADAQTTTDGSGVEQTDEPATSETESAAQTGMSEGAVSRLIAEVAAAPHKVYLLGRVRKAITAVGESELATRLRDVETDVLAQVSSRTAAKEALCERAEALKDSNAWKVTGDAFKALFDEWKTVGAAGRELDDQLWARFNLARGAFNERRAKHFEEREQVWSANREQKEALCAEAEAIVDSTDWKATAEKIRDLQARWKAVGSAGREKDEALWARFNTAKQRFFDQRTEAWSENRKRKEALVVDAEALKDSTDWRTTGDALKAMQSEWKTIGPAGREHEDELWTRFRAATQVFFDRRSSTFSERDKSERDNLSKKLEICARAEALVYTGDPLSAAREAKDLQAQWKEIGPVPREQSEALWARFRGACDKIFESAHGERDRQQNEWHSRMRDAMTRKREQLNALRESITHDEANIERWRESLSTLKPGGKSDEIGRGLEDKIIDVMNRIRDKQGRVEELRSSINDIEAKLKE